MTNENNEENLGKSTVSRGFVVITTEIQRQEALGSFYLRLAKQIAADTLSVGETAVPRASIEPTSAFFISTDSAERDAVVQIEKSWHTAVHCSKQSITEGDGITYPHEFRQVTEGEDESPVFVCVHCGCVLAYDLSSGESQSA